MGHQVFTRDVTGIILHNKNMHSRSNHHELNHSCHLVKSQLNHPNFTKNQSLKKKLKIFCEGHMAISPSPCPGGDKNTLPTPHPLDAFILAPTTLQL